MIVSYDFAPRYNVENAARFNRIQLHHLYEHLFSLVQYIHTIRIHTFNSNGSFSD